MYVKNILPIFFFLIFSCKKNVDASVDYNYKMSVNERETYMKVKAEAWQLYKEGNYSESIKKYEEAFKAVKGNPLSNDRYNAACSYALFGDIEKAFHHLEIISQKPIFYRNYSHISTDTDLQNLHSDKRWDDLLNNIRKNKINHERKLDRNLISILDTIRVDDQKFRQKLDSVYKKFGWKSNEYKSLSKQIQLKDSINLVKVSNLLDRHGWLGEDVIGERGSQTLFLVIQHSDIDTQIKYLPLLKDAVKNNKASKILLAYLEDRILTYKGKKQKFGTQFEFDTISKQYYVWPLQDVDEIDQKRIDIGLGTMKELTESMGLEWDVTKHKERVVNFDKKTKNDH